MPMIATRIEHEQCENQDAHPPHRWFTFTRTALCEGVHIRRRYYVRRVSNPFTDHGWFGAPVNNPAAVFTSPHKYMWAVGRLKVDEPEGQQRRDKFFAFFLDWEGAYLTANLYEQRARERNHP